MIDRAELILPSRYAGRHHMWWLGGLLVVSLFAVVFGGDVWQSLGSFLPETVPNLSTYNKKASGYSGLFELAGKLGIDARRWQMSYRLLDPKKYSGTLVIVSPWETPTPGEMEFVSKWLADGNDLILLDDFGVRSSRALLSILEVSPSGSERERTVDAPISVGYPEATLVGNIHAVADRGLDGGSVVCAAHETAVLVETHVGKGRCLVGTIPQFCSNRNLNDPSAKSNYQFLINWLSTSRQPIYFDEKCHGFSSGNNVVFFLLRSPVGFILLQMLILLLVAVVSLNQRFGPAIAVSSARKISNLEFINGLAASYQQARARDTAWAMIFASFKARLCKMLGVAPHEGSEALARAWADREGKSSSQYETFLQQAEAALTRGKMDEAELIRLVGECDRLGESSPQQAQLR